MASTTTDTNTNTDTNTTPAPPLGAIASASVKWQQLTGYVADTGTLAVKNHAKVDIGLRSFMCVSAMVAVIVMASAKQTVQIQVSPTMVVSVPAKFTHSASFEYFVAAFSITFLYSIVTGIASYGQLKKFGRISTEKQIQFVILDSLMFGIVATATGAGGGVAYEALKGNPHIHWNKICHLYDEFCRHLQISMAVSFLASVTFLFLIWLSVYALARKATRRG